MERITMSIDEELAKEFDALSEEARLQSRRRRCATSSGARSRPTAVDYEARSYCVASLSYIYNHHERELAERLTEAQHAHHDLSSRAMHVHLDHDNCLESVDAEGADRGRARVCEPDPRRNAASATDRSTSSRVETGDEHSGPGAHHRHGHGHAHAAVAADRPRRERLS